MKFLAAQVMTRAEREQLVERIRLRQVIRIDSFDNNITSIHETCQTVAALELSNHQY